MPPAFAQLNRHGVARLPILIAVGLPIIVIDYIYNLETT